MLICTCIYIYIYTHIYIYIYMYIYRYMCVCVWPVHSTKVSEVSRSGDRQAMAFGKIFPQSISLNQEIPYAWLTGQIPTLILLPKSS